MTRVAWFEFRRSPFLYLSVPLFAIEVIGMNGAIDDWAGTWSAASVAAVWPMFIIASVLTGACAYLGVSRSLRGESILANAAVRRWKIEAAMLLPPVAVATATLAVGITWAHVIAWPTAHEGEGWIRAGFPLLGYSLMLIGCAVGHLTGRLVPSYWAPPVAAFGILAVAVTVGTPDGLLFVPMSAPIHLTLRPSAVLLPIAAGVVALGTAALAVGARRRPEAPPTARRAVLGIGLATVALTIAVVAGQPSLVPRTDNARPVCTSTSPRLCVFPEMPGAVPELAAMADRIAALPQARFSAPAELVQTGLPPVPGGVTFPAEGHRWFVADSLAGIVASKSGIGCVPMDMEGESASIASDEYFVVLEWLAARIYGEARPADVHSTVDGMLDQAEIAALLAMPDTAQLAWVDEHLSRMEAACVTRG